MLPLLWRKTLRCRWSLRSEGGGSSQCLEDAKDESKDATSSLLLMKGEKEIELI